MGELVVKLCDRTYLFNFPMSEFPITNAFSSSRTAVAVTILIYMGSPYFLLYEWRDRTSLTMAMAYQSTKQKTCISKKKSNCCWEVERGSKHLEHTSRSQSQHHNESSMRLAAWLRFQTASRDWNILLFDCVCPPFLLVHHGNFVPSKICTLLLLYLQSSPKFLLYPTI